MFNPSFANASGEMISTGEDMTTFFRALLGGKLLTPEMQKEMVTHTVDTPLESMDLVFTQQNYQMVLKYGDMVVVSLVLLTLLVERKMVNMLSR